MAFLQQKSTILFLVALNLSIPISLLAYRYTHRTRIEEVKEIQLFGAPRPEWVNLLDSGQPTTIHSHSLNLTFYADFGNAVLPASVTLTDNRNLNILDEEIFWGGQTRLTSRQLLTLPSFDFYPGQLEFHFKYQYLDGTAHEASSKVSLVFEDDFGSFGRVKARRSVWYYGPGVELVKEAAQSHGLLCEPKEQDKTELVFLKSYQDHADVTLEFRPLSVTPNLSVSFNERVSFIIGDGRNDQIKFKHKITPGHYYQQTWAMPALAVGQTYTAALRRRGNEYSLHLMDSKSRELGSATLTDPVTDDVGEKYPFIAFWVFSNQMPGSRTIKAITEIDKTEIFFPSK